MFIVSLVVSLFILKFHIFYAMTIQHPEVHLNQGIVTGSYEISAGGKRFASFYGVPYAEPPIGKHRFEEARPAEPWVGKYNATLTSSSCLQFDPTQSPSTDNLYGEENCLYANIFSPQLPNRGSFEQPLLDVIVFIHGGAFMFQSGHFYSPQAMMDADVVLVTFNYRLGPLGFLSTEDYVIPGNNGLKDQVLALKWIKENINAFGGHQDRITLIGSSAGGASVHYHMLSTKSKGFFRSAVAMSGTALNPWAQTEGAREKAFRLGSVLGCHVTASLQLLACLRDRPARQIVYHSRIFMPWLHQPFTPFGPVVEKPSPDSFIDRHPIDIIRAGVPNDVPLLLSHTSHEGLFPGAEIVCNRTNLQNLTDNWLKVAPHLFDYNYTSDRRFADDASRAVWLRYMGDRREASVEGIIQALGERHFTAGIVHTAVLQALSTKSHVYLNKFSYRGQNSYSDFFCGKQNFGVSHGDDVSYILPMSLVNVTRSSDDAQMAQSMVQMMAHYATFGVPKFGSSVEHWQEVKDLVPVIPYFNIDSPHFGNVEFIKDMNHVDFWNTLGLSENMPRHDHVSWMIAAMKATRKLHSPNQNSTSKMN